MGDWKTRRYQVAEVETVDELAERLCGKNAPSSWCGCTGWSVRAAPGMLALNISFSGDSLQEYAILREVERGDWRQVESFTTSWMTPERFAAAFRKAAAGTYDHEPWARRRLPPLTTETPDEHGRCWLCM